MHSSLRRADGQFIFTIGGPQHELYFAIFVQL